MANADTWLEVADKHSIRGGRNDFEIERDYVLWAISSNDVLSRRKTHVESEVPALNFEFGGLEPVVQCGVAQRHDGNAVPKMIPQRNQ